MQGSWSVGSHEEKAETELEELNVESHDSRERPSWFRAEMEGHKEILRNKIKRVNAFLDMMRWCSATVVSHPNIAALVSKLLCPLLHHGWTLKVSYLHLSLLMKM